MLLNQGRFCTLVDIWVEARDEAKHSTMHWTVCYNKEWSGLEVEKPSPKVFSFKDFHPELTRVSWLNSSSGATDATTVSRGTHFMPLPGRLFQMWLLPDRTASPGSLLCCEEHWVVEWTAPHPMKQRSELTLISPSWDSVHQRARAEPFYFLLMWRSSQSHIAV